MCVRVECYQVWLLRSALALVNVNESWMHFMPRDLAGSKLSFKVSEKSSSDMANNSLPSDEPSTKFLRVVSRKIKLAANKPIQFFLSVALGLSLRSVIDLQSNVISSY